MLSKGKRYFKCDNYHSRRIYIENDFNCVHSVTVLSYFAILFIYCKRKSDKREEKMTRFTVPTNPYSAHYKRWPYFIFIKSTSDTTTIHYNARLTFRKYKIF